MLWLLKFLCYVTLLIFLDTQFKFLFLSFKFNILWDVEAILKLRILPNADFTLIIPLRLHFSTFNRKLTSNVKTVFHVCLGNSQDPDEPVLEFSLGEYISRSINHKVIKVQHYWSEFPVSNTTLPILPPFLVTTTNNMQPAVIC